MNIIAAILVLGCIGALGAVTLSFIAKKFYVYEDPKIAEIEGFLPGANCGGCGRKGCHDFAVQCVQQGDLNNLFCPSAGNQGMQKIAEIMGCVSESRQPHIAVVRCAGTKETKTALNAQYVGPRSCSVMNMTAGDYECDNSCLGCGDCTKVCNWNAIKISPDSNLPEVNDEKCTGCGKCVTFCPRHIIELRPKGIKNRRVWVACSNCLKGPLTRKQCKVGCIACQLCIKACPFEAISIIDNHAYIDPLKCKTCGKCISVCPTKAINSVNVVIKPKTNEAVNV